MSVICYGREEILLALVAAWHHGSPASSDGKRKLEQYAELGNLIMAANAAAYTCAYEEVVDPREPITSFDVKRLLMVGTVADRQQGVRVLRGIRYNLIANNGEDFATVDILDGLLWFTRCLLERAEMLRGAA